jgi:hypothetical protein
VAASAGVVETVPTKFGGTRDLIGKPGTTVWVAFLAKGHTGSGDSSGSHLYESFDPAGGYTSGNKDGEVVFLGRGSGNANYGYERTCGHSIGCANGINNGLDYQSSHPFNDGVEHWVVYRFDFGATTDVTMWFDPTPGPVDLDPASAESMKFVNMGGMKTTWSLPPMHFGWVELEALGAKVDVDEYRIGTTFADVSDPTGSGAGGAAGAGGAGTAGGAGAGATGGTGTAGAGATGGTGTAGAGATGGSGTAGSTAAGAGGSAQAGGGSGAGTGGSGTAGAGIGGSGAAGAGQGGTGGVGTGGSGAGGASAGSGNGGATASGGGTAAGGKSGASGASAAAGGKSGGSAAGGTSSAAGKSGASASAGGASADAPAESDSGGCGCSVPGRTTGATWAVGLVVAALAVRRRRGARVSR